jgi:hypothetical protein
MSVDSILNWLYELNKIILFEPLASVIQMYYFNKSSAEAILCITYANKVFTDKINLFS